MHLSARFWSCISYVTNILTLSGVDSNGSQQLVGGHDLHARPLTAAQLGAKLSKEQDRLIFAPPGWRPRWNGDTFFCNYSYSPTEWEVCAETNRSCWIRNKKTGFQFDIDTDYETKTPNGTVREFSMDVVDGKVNADGMRFLNAKLVEGKYPGPLIQACWGDTMKITVKNKLRYNGTAIHWHGIRQLDSMEADGVPGITQCPIPPEGQYTYNFKMLQYGSAWYHSHYSVQYADGLLGPLTSYGPHSVHWDEAIYPLIMNDWFHNSAYAVIHGTVPGYPSVLLNGTGDVTKYGYMQTNDNGQDPQPIKDVTDPNSDKQPPEKLVGKIPSPYRLHFDPTPIKEVHADGTTTTRKRRYLLRLINASFSTGFVFSIDHHKLKVISADFVSIHPFETTHLHIGIGQRYNVIVEAEPHDYPDGTSGTRRKLFYIRTTWSSCFRDIGLKGGLPGYDQTGVLSYYSSVPGAYDPKDPPGTTRWPQINGDTACRDEDLSKLKPIVPWMVGLPANQDPIWMKPDVEINRKSNESAYLPNGTWTNTPGERFDVVGTFMLKGSPSPPAFMPDFPVARFSFERAYKEDSSFEPMQIDYDQALILQLGKDVNNQTQIPRKWGIVEENVNKDDWIYLALGGRIINPAGGIQTAGAHPIHLHGHDFAILQQEENMELTAANININNQTLINPPRRDVVLLPTNGFVVIAFKADNPGSWIMHCHIAFHASEGLALQFLERQSDAYKRWNGTDPVGKETRRVCDEWKTWQDNCTLHWPGKIEGFGCYPACNNNKNKKYAELSCKNLIYDDSGI